MWAINFKVGIIKLVSGVEERKGRRVEKRGRG